MNAPHAPAAPPQPSPTMVSLCAVAASPWLNGKGLTRELMAWPNAQAWRMRFSVADIESDGPFSPWIGVTRHFCVLDGAGVVLRWDEGHEERLTPDTPPLCFSGGEPPNASLIDGPTRDLNLMTRDGLSARLVANDGGPQARPWGCFVANRTQLHITDDTSVHTTIDVPAMTLVWLHDTWLHHTLLHDRAVRATFSGRGWWVTRETRQQC